MHRKKYIIIIIIIPPKALKTYLEWNLKLPNSCGCSITIMSTLIYWKLHPGQG